MRFSENVAVVTGGGRGIGAACVRRFAQDGAAVVVADRDEAPASTLAREVTDGGGRAIAKACDVAVAASVQALFDTAVDAFGHVDFLVTCAGILRFNRIEDISEEEWDDVVDTHLKGTFLCAQAASRLMTPRQFGKMVLVSSGAARGFSMRAHYSAAKAGIQTLAKVLAIELGPSNINVNVVAPGLIETRMPEQHAAWLGEDYEAFKARIAAQTPLRRTGSPEDLASVVAFLCSEEASFVTGEIINVSGGA